MTLLVFSILRTDILLGPWKRLLWPIAKVDFQEMTLRTDTDFLCAASEIDDNCLMFHRLAIKHGATERPIKII